LVLDTAEREDFGMRPSNAIIEFIQFLKNGIQITVSVSDQLQ